jgi:site-specific DNA recombinase
MPSTNGHGLKQAILWVILYMRVSGDEQKKKGYSLVDQRAALRAWARSEGYTILEEVEDGAWSGGSLTRPGLDRVRERVAEGGVYAVAALYRDRFARGIYAQLLQAEFAEHGTRLVALNSQGDDSPDGELADGIMDVISGWERKKIAERTRRGKLRKAREGRSVSPTPKYGFRFDDAHDGLVVYEPEMAVVERIFRMAADGLGVRSIQSRLYAEGVPSPRGGKVWDRRVLRRIVASDEYGPLTFEEIEKLVSPEVASRLDPHKQYGVQWYNRDRATVRTVAEPDGNGGTRYRKRKTLRRRPKDEWLAIPVPGHLPRDLVDQARAAMDANTGSERKHLARQWELRGLVRCSCGSKMQTKTTKPNGHTYHYYYCVRRNELRRMCSCTQQALRAAEVESAVWSFISGLLKDPEKVRAGMERLIEREQATRTGDRERDGKVWAEKLEECSRLRAAYQDQQAAGLMTLDELASKLRDLEETRLLAQLELDALAQLEARVEELEENRDALIASYTSMVPDALENLISEERNKVYRMLQLEVSPTPEGYQVSGAFCTNGQTTAYPSRANPVSSALRARWRLPAALRPNPGTARHAVVNSKRRSSPSVSRARNLSSGCFASARQRIGLPAEP